MAQEIYHRSNWGIASNEWGSTYLNADLTNELYKRAGYYENSWATDKILNKIGTKPSIIMTPTAYKDGKLNSVKPAKVIGEELITNGDFSSTDISMITGAGTRSVVNGQLKIEESGLSYSQVMYNGILDASKTYKATFDITLGAGSYNIYNTTQGFVSITSSGSYTFYLKSTNRLYVGSNGVGDVWYMDNVSVKEVTDADFDFTRGSSATRVNEKGLIEITDDTDLPRINYTNFDYENGEVVPYSGEGSLLLEPQSTNVLENSEITSTWTYTEYGSGSSGTITTGKIDMFGNTNAAQIDFPSDVENVTLNFGQTTSSISSGSVSGSVYIKLIESGSKTLQLRCSSGLKTLINVNETNFVRYQLSGTKTNNEALTLKLRPSEGTSSGGFSIIVCQPQEEAIPYPTSYIPTNGTTVTRLADVANNAGNADLINSTEGVLYAEMATLADDLTRRILTITDGTLNNIVKLEYKNTSNQLEAVVYNGLTQCLLVHNLSDSKEYIKIAFKYKQNDFALWVDGIERLTDTSGVVFPQNTLNNLSFYQGNLNYFYGNVKSVAVFKEALSDEELHKLTSPYESFEQRVKADGGDIESLNCIPRTYR